MILRDKVVLLTGATGGIGGALARALAAQGARLILSGRRAEQLAAVASGITGSVTLDADLACRNAATTLAEQALAVTGRVDVLINNAAGFFCGTQADVGDAAAARAVFESNYWSALALTRALVPGMVQRQCGAVVNVSSINAIAAGVLLGHYGASKAALWNATETLRLELRNTGVHVMLVALGAVATAALDKTKQLPGYANMLKGVPVGTPEKSSALIVRGLQRKTHEVVYPRPMWFLRALPLFAKHMSYKLMPLEAPLCGG